MRLVWLGSGEFEPWHHVLDDWMLALDESSPSASQPKVLIIPTASAPEGDDVFMRWGRKGLEHYGAHGVSAELLRLKTRDDALDGRASKALETASAVFFSGGNPAYLSSVMAGTPFWQKLLERLESGMAYAGCSAGVACLAAVAPDSNQDSVDQGVLKPGLGLTPEAWMMPHWDALDGYSPGLTSMIIEEVPVGTTLIGIDEKTAMYGDGSSWTVHGKGGIHVMTHGDEWDHHRDGGSFKLPLIREA